MRVFSKGAAAVRVAARVFDFIFLRHRASIVLITAHIALFARLYEDSVEAPKPLEHRRTPRETIFPVHGLEPLTRGSVLVQTPAGTTKCRRRATLRRDTAPSANETGKQLDEEDAPAILQRALASGTFAGASSPSQLPNVDTVEVHIALSGMHSARAQYDAAKKAMDIALQRAREAGSVEALAVAYFKLAQLEWDHHRYPQVEALVSGNSSENLAVNTSAVAGLSCMGAWAMMMRGDLERAEQLFLKSLADMGFDSGACHARRDGFDAYRSFALSGLSLISSRRATKHLDQREALQKFSECARTLILQSNLYDCGGPAMLQHTRHALGLAELARGRTAAARRQSTIALQLRHEAIQISSSASTASPGVDMCSKPVSASCSHAVLNLALVAFAGGDEMLGKSYVDNMLGSSTLESNVEPAEWLLSFARVHAWLPGGDRLASFLMERAMPLMRNTSHDGL